MRTGYAHAAWHDEHGAVHFRTEQEVRDHVKARFAHLKVADAWMLHCAALEGCELRRRVPSGRMEFGGRKNLERRRKGLISNADWKALRLRSLQSRGDKQYAGNRHFKLAEDGRTCTVQCYGRKIELKLPKLHGKWGVLLPAVARLAAAGEINVTFTLGRKLAITFDPKDLRKLPPGLTLQQADDLARGDKGKRGRPRGANWKPAPLRWSDVKPRPVHPDWMTAARTVPHRAVGIDLNPGWIGISVIENRGDVSCLADTRLLDSRLIRLDLPKNAPTELVRETLARVAGVALSMARAWGCGVIGLESGLGKLRSRTRNKSLNHLLNSWDRNSLTAMLARRCGLSGLRLRLVWGGYGTTISNIGFSAPDACAAAAEIARRTLARHVTAQGEETKETLPVFDADLARSGLAAAAQAAAAGSAHPGPRRGRKGSRRKDREGVAKRTPEERLADVLGRTRDAADWQAIHREVKKAGLGTRRPHPEVPSPSERIGGGAAVRRLGHRGRPGLLLRPALMVRVSNSPLNGVAHQPVATPKCG